MSHVCVMVVYGLPGSGKTTLCKFFLKNLKKNRENSDIIHICFDKLALQFSVDNYKEFRNQALHFVERNVVDKLPYKNKKTIFLLDDIMYLSSMRRKYYILCKKYSISYCQVFIKCDTPLAVQRIGSRTDKEERYKRVYPESVVKIASKLQVPSAEPWERFTAQMDAQKPLNMNTNEIMWNTIKSAMLCPVEPFPDDMDEMDDDDGKVGTDGKGNQLHKIDIILRKHISNLLRTLKEKEAGETFSDAGRRIANKKKLFMEHLKKGEFDYEKERDEEIIKLFEKFQIDL